MRREEYSIIIPSKTENNIRVCLEALQSKQPGWRGRVLVYDNDFSGGVEKACEDFGVTRVEGELPFIFSRAVNRCMDLCPNNDVILLNDDAVLQTRFGFDRLHYESNIHPEFGIVSPAILGFVGNPEQHAQSSTRVIRPATLHTIVFICVHILRDVIDCIGPLDERLIHYGWEDNLYCLQARMAGWSLGIFDGCIVEHGDLPSTFRTPGPGGIMPGLDDNWAIFERIIREKGLDAGWPVPFRFIPLRCNQVHTYYGPCCKDFGHSGPHVTVRYPTKTDTINRVKGETAEW